MIQLNSAERACLESTVQAIAALASKAAVAPEADGGRTGSEDAQVDDAQVDAALDDVGSHAASKLASVQKTLTFGNQEKSLCVANHALVTLLRKRYHQTHEVFNLTLQRNYFETFYFLDMNA